MVPLRFLEAVLPIYLHICASSLLNKMFLRELYSLRCQWMQLILTKVTSMAAVKCAFIQHSYTVIWDFSML